MKKAYLMTFEVTTRVVTDVPEDFDPKHIKDDVDDKVFDEIAEKGSLQIIDESVDYLLLENVSNLVEDTECPYGTYEHEK